MINKFFTLTRGNLREVLFSTPKFLLLLFSFRLLCWGFSAYFFNFTFSLGLLHWLSNPEISISGIILGILGLIGVIYDIYYCSITFLLFNLLIFSLISLTYLQFDPKSMAAINYFVEMLGSIWLVFRIQHDHYINKNIKKYLE